MEEVFSPDNHSGMMIRVVERRGQCRHTANDHFPDYGPADDGNKDEFEDVDEYAVHDTFIPSGAAPSAPLHGSPNQGAQGLVGNLLAQGNLKLVQGKSASGSGDEEYNPF